ncbi:flagellar hook-basal body complex protein FliE [Kushneria aurantia]|uniref:Flagellar hook-basal body complex protein FliE n=1 Tax=Kushneria aurantia TaxID=504092 RepID=A0ABV6G0X8_9GAMM|nr:flagellar hook-basal body complex protein FliE [Kushneria aurantia]
MAIESVGQQFLLEQMEGMARQAAAGGQAAASREEGGVSFAGELKGALDNINALKMDAADKTEAFARGDSGVALNDVMVSMQKSSVATEMGVQVRNRVLSAYREIMSMQV